MKRINIIISLLIISAILLSFSGCSFYNLSYIDKWVPQENVAYFDECDLYYNGNILYMPELIQNHNLLEMMIIYKVRIYFIQEGIHYNDNGNERYIWYIRSVNTDGGDYKNNYTSDFNRTLDFSDYKGGGYHSLALNEEYMYYYNGKIVLQDFTKLVEYDLRDRKTPNKRF